MRCDCILVLLALLGAFSMIPPCEFSPCKSLTVGPLWWYKGPWIKRGACGSASQRRGQRGHFDPYKDNFNFKHVSLSLPQPSLVSLRQHCALFPVAMEVCSVATKILHSVPRKHHQSWITSHGLQTLTHLTHSHTVSPPVYVCISAWCPARPSGPLSWMICLDLCLKSICCLRQATETKGLLFFPSRVAGGDCAAIKNTN